MKMYMKGNKRSKETSSPIPNTIAYAAIKNFLVSKEFAETREEYCIGKLDKKQVSQIMTDIKWLFRNYKDMEVLTIEDSDNKAIRFIL
ncbi:hypothetical protein K0040_18045 [Terrisporobacter petrolearius]|uniref:hypothetical protein n=1 Tax=Terrisporobacter petrolearius TaxID=1460447 RepID=UPI001D1605E5|nr:hypothetical protein [Terrisporobacter petrolearius]MCC3866161.1 hypothetical protein [Terrisporobacter petrolearius]